MKQLKNVPDRLTGTLTGLAFAVDQLQLDLLTSLDWLPKCFGIAHNYVLSREDGEQQVAPAWYANQNRGKYEYELLFPDDSVNAFAYFATLNNSVVANSFSSISMQAELELIVWANLQNLKSDFSGRTYAYMDSVIEDVLAALAQIPSVELEGRTYTTQENEVLARYSYENPKALKMKFQCAKITLGLNYTTPCKL